MAALPYMQLYIADYLADTMHLSTEEHGAYLLLMFNYWQTGRAIPKSRLPKIARLSNDRWISVESSLKEFFSDNGSEWKHDRIERDLEGVRNSLEQKSAAGRASAKARKAKKGTESERQSNDRSTGVNSPLEQDGNGNPTNKDPDTDKDIKPKNNMPDAESDQRRAPPEISPEEIFISLPLIGGLSHVVTLNYLESRRELYPAVDVPQELRNMCGWLESNPKKRKTPNGIKKFITTWLQRCQDNPKNRQVTNGQNPTGNTESIAERQLREGREQYIRERQHHGGHSGMAAVGPHDKNLQQPLDCEEWQSSIGPLGAADWRNEQ